MDIGESRGKTCMKDLISVIVPVYNMEQYLERCVNSIRQQTYKEIEIILVDDGSTDASPQMCDTFAKEDGRIQVIHKQNGGLSDARNSGLAVAKGDYIGFVDSDDWIEPTMYERLYTACVNEGAQIAICRYAQVYCDKTIKSGTNQVHCFGRDELLRIYICDHDKYKIYNSVWSKLFRRDIVEGVMFPVGRNSEDIMYTTKAFCKTEKAAYVDECMYNYVLDRQDSIMNVKAEERMFRDEIPFWREHIACIREHVSEEMGDLAAYYFYRRLLSYYMRYAKERHDVASKLAQVIQQDKDQINSLYSQCNIAKGDQVRMRLFLVSPRMYGMIEHFYEQCVVPVKQKMRSS